LAVDGFVGLPLSLRPLEGRGDEPGVIIKKEILNQKLARLAGFEPATDGLEVPLEILFLFFPP